MIIMDENQMIDMCMSAPVGKWHVYYAGNLASDCQQGDKQEKSRSICVRDFAADLVKRGQAQMSFRSRNGVNEYLIARRVK